MADIFRSTLQRRMEEAEGHKADMGTAAYKKEEMAEPQHRGTEPFGKKWTEQEKAEHAKALAKKLRER